MTFSKGKIVFFWVVLLIALAIAVVGAVLSNESVSIVALVIAAADMVFAALQLRCPACGKVLVRVMKPWKGDCTCPGCNVNIKFM